MNDQVIKSSSDITTIESIPAVLPVLPLRDNVIFPYMIFPVLVGRETSIRAANFALDGSKYIFLAAQKRANVEEPAKEDIYVEGTIAKIIQILKLPNGLLKILVDGIIQGRIVAYTERTNFFEAEIEVVAPVDEDKREMNALMRQLTNLFKEYVKSNKAIPPEAVNAYENIDEYDRKLFYVSANINQAMDVIQKIQRKFIIQEQIRILQDELGDEEESSPEFIKLKERIDQAKMPEQVYEKAIEEFNKLRKTPPSSPEATVLRNYLDWLIDVPWYKKTKDHLDIKNVRKILDEDHYGLDKPKERIVEHIAVLNLVKNMRGQILCFVGPPGVGKTSLGKSIARALGRNFVRISLGGVRDEAEIRGHRRTYIGSMPGKIVQSMKKAKSINPVMLLDEIDKMSMDFRGDPSAAMLEVLDPEQNHTFNDHYLDIDYDLSQVMFITTANVRYNIPLPLQDRMEIIELPGYLEHEKVQIAKRHIIPKQIQAHGLEKYNVEFKDEAITKITMDYTREAGVRNLEREIASVLRKTAREIIITHSNNGKKKKSKKKFSIDPTLVEKFLGVPRFRSQKADKELRIGSVTGLAWTSVGGEILQVDATVMTGAEKLTLTGQIGNVMKESAQAALSYLRSNAKDFGLDTNFAKGKEIHIHLPEGAIPKDGPSAGITLALAMFSALSGKAARNDVAMTGEITLRGKVLPIGGLNEKLLAARRSGIKIVLIPKENEKDLSEIKAEVKDGLNIIPIQTIKEALPYVFETQKKRSKRQKK